jgi:hypothetical protein
MISGRCRSEHSIAPGKSSNPASSYWTELFWLSRCIGTQ